MSRKTLIVIIFSLFVVLVWIGTSVYANIAVIPTADNTFGLGHILAPVSTDMHTSALQDINANAGLIRISNTSLEPSATPTPTSSQ